MIANPFAPHLPAPRQSFVGRARERDLVFAHLLAAQPGNVAVSGPLGIGKTSLLQHVSDPFVAGERGARPPGHLVVYLDVQSVAPFSADHFWRRVAQRAARLPGAGLDGPLARLVERSTIGLIDVEVFLDALAARTTILALVLDEFEWALRADGPEALAECRAFVAQLATLARRMPRSFCLVVATERPLAEVADTIGPWPGSPWASLFTALELRPLEADDSVHLLRRALNGGATGFAPSRLAQLHASAGGQPAALQAAAFALFHGRQQGLDEDALWSAARQSAAQALTTLSATHGEPPVPDSLAAGSSMPASERAPRQVQVGPPASMPAGAPSPALWMDPATGEVCIDGRWVDALTPLESNLMRLLMASAGRLCSKEDIIRQLWGEDFVGRCDTSRVERLISRLRRKIELDAGRPRYVRTVRGRGYRLVPA